MIIYFSPFSCCRTVYFGHHILVARTIYFRPHINITLFFSLIVSKIVDLVPEFQTEDIHIVLLLEI
jgi:hypothetical protein